MYIYIYIYIKYIKIKHKNLSYELNECGKHALSFYYKQHLLLCFNAESKPKGLEKHEAEFGSCSSSIYSILAKFSQKAHTLCSKQEKENNSRFFSISIVAASGFPLFRGAYKHLCFEVWEIMHTNYIQTGDSKCGVLKWFI